MNNQDTIEFKEMISFMDSGAWFSIEFVTYDKKKETGGEWIVIDAAVKHGRETDAEREKMQHYQPVSSNVKRNPNHYQNSTRNIRLRNGGIRKVHLRLIRVFNNKIVI